MTASGRCGAGAIGFDHAAWHVGGYRPVNVLEVSVQAAVANTTIALAMPTTALLPLSVPVAYWEPRLCQSGSAQEDWLRAEKERRGAATTSEEAS